MLSFIVGSLVQTGELERHQIDRIEFGQHFAIKNTSFFSGAMYFFFSLPSRWLCVRFSIAFRPQSLAASDWNNNGKRVNPSNMLMRMLITFYNMQFVNLFLFILFCCRCDFANFIFLCFFSCLRSNESNCFFRIAHKTNIPFRRAFNQSHDYFHLTTTPKDFSFFVWNIKTKVTR